LQYNVEWDTKKAQLNLKKHGIGFELAASVFYDPRTVTIFDDEHGENEELWELLKTDSSLYYAIYLKEKQKILALLEYFRQEKPQSLK
jgi:uncharacterized DUF497 family protein